MAKKQRPSNAVLIAAAAAAIVLIAICAVGLSRVFPTSFAPINPKGFAPAPKIPLPMPVNPK